MLLHAHALGGSARHVDVKADQLVLLIAKAHGREVVVQAHDDLGDGSRCRSGSLGGGRGRGRGLVLAAGGQQSGQGQGGQQGALVHEG